jgi:hypothetical protein
MGQVAHGAGPLIAALEERRLRLRRSQRAQARALGGMHESLYSKLLTGERQPTLRVLMAAIREHPPLARYVARQVAFQAGLGGDGGSVGAAA